MKKLLTLLLLLHTVAGFAQAPSGFSFQAVIRDVAGNPLENATVGMRLSLLQGSEVGTAVYVETHTPTTNANGLVSLMIGNGTVVSGDMTTVDWADGPYFLLSETDTDGGTAYSIVGTQQLLSVPYALFAASAGGSGNTLDAAYDQGGPGEGRTITATDGAVRIGGEDGFMVTGTHGSGDAIEVSGAGARMFFNPLKSAFRAGATDGNHFDNANVGNYSFAAGFRSTASGSQSAAFNGNASGTLSFAVSGGQASALRSIALRGTATGPSSIALGASSATEENAVAIGFMASATAREALALGAGSIASGSASTAIGIETVASGSGSTAIGFTVSARAAFETALGVYNTDYTPSETATDRLLVVGNGTIHIGGVGTITRSNALVILKNGNTGIGIDSPQARLAVGGKLMVTGASAAATGVGNVLTSLRDATATVGDAPNYVLGISRQSTATEVLYIGNDGNDNAVVAANNRALRFGRDLSGVFTENMRLTTAGNLGIGTDSPARRLHVNDVMRLEPRSTAPGSASMGDMYMNSSTTKLMVYDGTIWRACW